LVTYTVLTQGTAQGLADWCEASPEQADQLMTALKDTALLRLFLQSGGARNGKYGPAIQAYRRLTQSSNVAHHAFLHDLALATSLELADPYDLFNQRGKTDIVLRYTHYEQAYLLGELDPLFGMLNVWELRQVVNSDATEDELSWGRRSLEAYRPDICLWSDEQWSYCEVVKTDVAYKDPEYVLSIGSIDTSSKLDFLSHYDQSFRLSLFLCSFYKEPRSYDQILSGGGECGPRAWYVFFQNDSCRCVGFLLGSSPSNFEHILAYVNIGTADSFARRLAYPRGGCDKKATRPCHAGPPITVGSPALALALPGPGGTTKAGWTFCSRRRHARRVDRSRISRNGYCVSSGLPPFTRRTQQPFAQIACRTESRRGIRWA
jgi:hypothetical protein